MEHTCTTCNFQINRSFLRDHCKTEFHRYNCFRSQHSYPPVSEEEFLKIIENRKSNNVEKQSYFCCGKKYNSKKTYEDHLKSKKHICKFNDSDEKIESEDINENFIEDYSDFDDVEVEIEPLTISDCFFCDEYFTNMIKNLRHMENNHGFNIPYKDYVSDLEGLLNYVKELVDIENVCVQCNKQFIDRLSIRNHMKDANHYQLYFGDVLECYGELPPKPEDIIDDGIMPCKPNGEMIFRRDQRYIANQRIPQEKANAKYLKLKQIEGGNATLDVAHRSTSGALMKKEPQQLTADIKRSQNAAVRHNKQRQHTWSNFQKFYRLQNPI